MKNRRNIIESELPPQNPLDIWMKDGKFYRSTKKGWTLIEDQMEFTDSKLMYKSTATSGTIGVNKETGKASIYNDVTKEWSPLGGGLTETTWQELKNKRDAGKLTPGSLYRITDYNCTTTQENTKSAGHQFDIVLLALSENKLAEEGWAMMHDNIYDVTFSDGVTKKCYLYEIDRGYNVIDISTLLGYVEDNIEINETNKTAITDHQTDVLIIPDLPYNYFQNSKLEAWKVWYSLDNDKSRFAWADDRLILHEIMISGSPQDYIRTPESDLTIDGVKYYAWVWIHSQGGTTKYTLSETPKHGDALYQNFGGMVKTGEVDKFFLNGRGVIYRLIDEFNNDIKYDFKNIQFKRKLTDGSYDANGTETWCYTLNVWYNDMCQDASIVGNTLPNYWHYISGVYDNVFGYATAMDLFIEGANTFAFVLGNNVVLSFLQFSIYSGIYSNTIGNDFYGNTIGNDFNSNIIGNHFSNNTIGNSFYYNTIGNGFGNNTIGNDFYDNTIGNDFIFNTIGNSFGYNTIGNSFQHKNISTQLTYANYGNNGVELATKS